MVAKHGFFETNGDLHNGMQYVLPLDDLLIHIAAITDVGVKRTQNEDNYLFSDELLVLCDGMGGHAQGEIASKIACNYFAAHAHDASHALDDVASGAHNAVLAYMKHDPDTTGMGCTAVVARFLKTKMLDFTNVGDSRLYRYSIKNGNPHLEQLTEDHSLAWMTYKNGKVTKDEMAHLKNKNMITACIGGEDTMFVCDQVQQHSKSIQPNEVYLLCSDGLSDMLKDSEIAAIMTESYAKFDRNDTMRDHAVAQALVDAAKTAGGKDNITVVLARISQEQFSFTKMYMQAAHAFFSWLRSLPFLQSKQKRQTENKTGEQIDGHTNSQAINSQAIYTDTFNAFFARDYDSVAKNIQTHRDQFLAAQTSKADFLLGVAALQNKHYRDAIASFENCIAHAAEEERIIADTSYFPHAVRSLAYAYAVAYRSPLQRKEFLKKATDLRLVSGVQGTLLSTEIEQALHHRVHDIGEQLISGFYDDAVREPLLAELRDFAHVTKDFQELQSNILEVYRRITDKAVHHNAQVKNNENEIIDLKNEIQYLRETTEQNHGIARDNERYLEAQLHEQENKFEQLLRQYGSLCDAFAQRGREDILLREQNATLDRQTKGLKRKYHDLQKDREERYTRVRTYVADIFAGLGGLLSQWREKWYTEEGIEAQNELRTLRQEKQLQKYEHIKQTAVAVAETVGRDIRGLWKDLLEYRERREFDARSMEVRDVRYALQDVQHGYDVTRRLHDEAAQDNNKLYADNCRLQDEKEVLQKQLTETAHKEVKVLEQKLQEQPEVIPAPVVLPPLHMMLPEAAFQQEEDVPSYILLLRERHQKKG